MKHLLIIFFAGFSACTSPASKPGLPVKGSPISETAINQSITTLKQSTGISDPGRLEKGVKHIASLWRTEDGTEQIFMDFCKKNFIADESERVLFFEKVSKNLESLLGHFNKITLDLKENIDLNNGPVLNIDKEFSGYSVGNHMLNDLYANKIAFMIALNFPYYSLEEKSKFSPSFSRKAWAMARLGDVFISRVPAELDQSASKSVSDADLYISEYNIEMGKLLTETGKTLFPENMSLLTHWNLRDEIKANYGNEAK